MDFIENVKLIYGDKGLLWLENLPHTVTKLARKWNLIDLVPCEDLSYNYVMSGWRNDLPIILKIGIGCSEIQQECSAIRAFNGYGLIKLLEADLDYGAILITRAVPGKTLVSLFHDADDKALGIACNLARQLHKATIPSDHKFPLLSEWFNIGDPMYDMTGCLLREPFKQMMALPDVKDMLQHRMKFVAEYLKTDLKQVWAWTYIQSVMSICWSLEDGQDVSLKRVFLDILEESYTV